MMSIQRLKEIEALGVSRAELLQYSFIKNSSVTIALAAQEHGITLEAETDIELTDFEPEEALDFALERLSGNILTVLLRPHGYQPIPNRKQAKREKALSH